MHGVVKDLAGKPVASATVTAVLEDATTIATTDERGEYTLETVSGATLFVATGGRMATAQVGYANIDREVVDLVLDEEADLE